MADCIKKILLCVLMVLIAAPVFAAIQGTVHDMSFSNASNTFYRSSTEDEICVFCHTPHGGVLNGPLWSKPMPAPVGGFQFYSNAAYAFKTEMNSVGTVNDESLLCLSCHDGSVGVNNLVNRIPADWPRIGASPPGAEVFIPGTPGANKRIGGHAADVSGTGHLEDDHPISMNYETAVSDNGAGLHTITDARISGIVFSPKNTGNTGNRLECSTCHEVHDNTFPPFLVMDNTASVMCLACHIK